MLQQFFLDSAKSILSILPEKLQFPPVYRKTKRLIKDSEKWDIYKIENWQLQKLKFMISYAYKNIPGYYELYKNQNIKPEDIRNLNDIKLLPFVSKQLLRDNLKDFTSSAIPKWKLKYLTTGGSTGIPFGFYTTIRNYYIETAFMNSAWESVGWKYGNLSAMLRGSFIGSGEVFYKCERFNNTLYLSNYYLNDKSYSKYKFIVEKFKPVVFQAYPSAITMLSDLIIDNNDCGKWNFKIIFLGSENIYQWQRDKIRKAFPNSKIHTWYGHAEKVIYAPCCANSDLLHISPIYGYTEILDSKNNEVNLNEKGELVGTSFWNFATPFIRYRTNDIALKNEFGCKECGRQHQLLTRIEGRIHEFIVSINNRYVSMTSINMHDDIFDKLLQFQFYQDTPGKVIFKYIPKSKFENSDIETITVRLKPKLGDDFEFETKQVKEIYRNKSGKFTFLEQKLEIKYKNEYE
ncbi:MAG: hypothetical protein RO257_02495 [Candidatus Kapabacteria bacterium]|nr:hypothetical protein [Candidatus Kapabacteria bacterium]